MLGHRKNQRDLDTGELLCADVDNLTVAFCEGSLGIHLAVGVYRHVAQCHACRDRVVAFREFLLQTSATDFVPLPDGDALRVTAATHLARWRELLHSWLDALYPGSVPALAFRGAEQRTVSERDKIARSRSERPFLEVRDERIHLIVHRARGRLLGRVDGADGLPLFPVLVGLENSRNGGPVLNRLDGTFSTDWDPEATGLVCWTPMGGKSHFPFNHRQDRPVSS